MQVRLSRQIQFESKPGKVHEDHSQDPHRIEAELHHANLIAQTDDQHEIEEQDNVLDHQVVDPPGH